MRSDTAVAALRDIAHQIDLAFSFTTGLGAAELSLRLERRPLVGLELGKAARPAYEFLRLAEGVDTCRTLRVAHTRFVMKKQPPRKMSDG